MTETKKKREPIIICLAVVVAYIAMYILTILYENAIAPGIQIGYVLKMNIESMVIALVLALIPYERLNYIWHRDIVGYWFETKSMVKKIANVFKLDIYDLLVEVRKDKK